MIMLTKKVFAVQIKRQHMLTEQASRCRPLDPQSIDDVMIRSSNTPPEDFMQMLDRNDVFERYICESSGKHQHCFCNQIILYVNDFLYL